MLHSLFNTISFFLTLTKPYGNGDMLFFTVISTDINADIRWVETFC